MYETTLVLDSRGQYRSSGQRSSPSFVLNEDICFSAYYIEEFTFTNNIYNLREDVTLVINSNNGNFMNQEKTLRAGVITQKIITDCLNNLVKKSGNNKSNEIYVNGYEFRFIGNTLFLGAVNRSSDPFTCVSTDGDVWTFSIKEGQTNIIGIQDLCEIFNVDYNYSFGSDMPLFQTRAGQIRNVIPKYTVFDLDFNDTTLRPNPLTLLVSPTEGAKEKILQNIDLYLPKYLYITSNLSDGNLSQNQFKLSTFPSTQYNKVIGMIPLNTTQNSIKHWTNSQTVTYDKATQQYNCPTILHFKFYRLDVDGMFREVDFDGTYFVMKIKFMSYRNQ